MKPRAQLLAPIIPEKGLVMLYGPRGMGKTNMGLAMAYAVASGGKVLRWSAPAPKRVLYVDGEMPLITLQERLGYIVKGSEAEAAPDYFRILAADYFEAGGLPNLATKAGQTAIDHLLDGVALLVIDNLSTLATAGRDNDAESWTPVQEWLLALRRRGISVLLIHHAGKGGQQRGTSRREDVLDTVIALRRPSDYSPQEGARCEVHLEKARGVYGDDAKPFEAKLENIGDGTTWTTRDLEDAEMARVVALLHDGLTIRDIADELGISKSAARAAEEEGRGLGRHVCGGCGVSAPPQIPFVPLSHALGVGTVGQTGEGRDSLRDSRGTTSLKALADKAILRAKQRDNRGTASENLVPPSTEGVGQEPGQPRCVRRRPDRWQSLPTRAASRLLDIGQAKRSAL